MTPGKVHAVVNAVCFVPMRGRCLIQSVPVQPTRARTNKVMMVSHMMHLRSTSIGTEQDTTKAARANAVQQQWTGSCQP
eukprot:1251558-Amphidinium_carterae.1